MRVMGISQSWTSVGYFIVTCNSGLPLEKEYMFQCLNQNLECGNSSNNYAVFTPTGELVKNEELAGATNLVIDFAGLVFAIGYFNNNIPLSIYESQDQVIHNITQDYPQDL